MARPDDLFKQAQTSIQRLGLREIPFTESPTGFEDTQQLERTFTGREAELTKVFRLLGGRERRRILIYGRIGIGKSAFLLESLSILRREKPKMLFTYTSLPANVDLATTALIAIAKALPNDDWTQRQLYQMGIPTDKPIKERNSEISASVVIGAKSSEKDIAPGKLQYPTVALDILIDRALETYPEGVVIAIDDLDKQNPAYVRQLMHDAQGILKGRAWFMLTGHPTGITTDLYTSERGLFDLQLELTELDFETTYQMLVNYLNSARINAKDCIDDPNDPRSVLPFLPETAHTFCQRSQGKPRLFNRLGNIVLSTAAELGAKIITEDVLQEGLKVAKPTLRQLAALTFQEEQVLLHLEKEGSLDEETPLEVLEKLGFQSFNEVLPILEKLENADLAERSSQGDIEEFSMIDLPFGEFQG